MRHMEPQLLRESIEEILHIIGLVNDRQTLSQNLSGGMKRRLSIGISLIGDPKVFASFSLLSLQSIILLGTHSR
jgi:ABC-type multidrug transport system ATPase subunit